MLRENVSSCQRATRKDALLEEASEQMPRIGMKNRRDDVETVRRTVQQASVPCEELERARDLPNRDGDVPETTLREQRADVAPPRRCVWDREVDCPHCAVQRYHEQDCE